MTAMEFVTWGMALLLVAALVMGLALVAVYFSRGWEG